MEKKAGNAEAQVSPLPEYVDQPTKSCFQSESEVLFNVHKSSDWMKMEKITIYTY